jgi:hypothetical protein
MAHGTIPTHDDPDRDAVSPGLKSKNRNQQHPMFDRDFPVADRLNTISLMKR